MLILLLIGGSITGLYLFNMKEIFILNEEHARSNIIDVKKTFLEDNVDNLFLDISEIRGNVDNMYERQTQDVVKSLKFYYANGGTDFLQTITDYFNDPEMKTKFTVVIYDKELKQYVYENLILGMGSNKMDFQDRVDKGKENLATYYVSEFGPYQMFWGINKKYVEDHAKEQIYDLIYRKEYSSESTLWVNEILTYEGGNAYAIRRILPKAPDMEGTLLSTKMKDAIGSLPYETELNGIIKDGELFYTYYYRDEKTNGIAERLIYTRLYKEYDWVIAMDIGLKDMDIYIQDTTKKSEAVMKKMISIILLGMIIVFVFGLLALEILERWYFINSQRKVKEEIFRDPLTNAFNRRAGTNFLSQSFKNYRKSEQSPAVFMIDVDDFKQINDTYGHDVGDFVLVKICESINKHIRNSDVLIRWGGEEFLLLCDGLKKEDIPFFADKLVQAVERYQFDFAGQERSITISMGVSYFQSLDKGYEQALKRADEALYMAKERGKNQFCVKEE